MVGEHRPDGDRVAGGVEFRTRIGEPAGAGGEFVEDRGQRLGFRDDLAPGDLGRGARKEEAVVDRRVGHPGMVVVRDRARGVGHVGGAVVGVQRGEAVADLEERFLVAQAEIRVRVLRQRERRRERHAGIDGGGHPAEARGHAEAAVGLPAGDGRRLDDLVPVVGRAQHHFVARRGEGVAVRRGGARHAVGIAAGHGRHRVRVRENREGQGILGPAEVEVMDAEDSRLRLDVGQGDARRPQLQRSRGAAPSQVRRRQRVQFAAGVEGAAQRAVAGAGDPVARPGGQQHAGFVGTGVEQGDRQVLAVFPGRHLHRLAVGIGAGDPEPAPGVEAHDRVPRRAGERPGAVIGGRHADRRIGEDAEFSR